MMGSRLLQARSTERLMADSRIGHNFYCLNGILYTVQAERKAQVSKILVMQSLVETLTCYTTHFVVQIGPFVLLAGAVQDEADNLGIDGVMSGLCKRAV